MHFCRGQRNSRKSVTNLAADQTAALLLTPAHDLTFTYKIKRLLCRNRAPRRQHSTNIKTSGVVCPHLWTNYPRGPKPPKGSKLLTLPDFQPRCAEALPAHTPEPRCQDYSSQSHPKSGPAKSGPPASEIQRPDQLRRDPHTPSPRSF